MAKWQIGAELKMGPNHTVPFQTMLHPSRNHVTTKHVDNYKTFKPYTHDGIYRVAHSAYVTVPWSKDKDVRAKSLVDIERSVEICHKTGLSAYLLHLPATISTEEDFANHIRAIETVWKHVDVELVLEEVAAKPKISDLPSGVVEQLMVINQVVKGCFTKKYGFCLDTAHIFARGVAMTTEGDVIKLMEALADIPIALVHLNGNEIDFDKGRDKHCNVGSAIDKIWGEDISGALMMIKICREKNIPIILERHNQNQWAQYEEEVNKLEGLMKKKR